jgi:hypothetical protein
MSNAEIHERLVEWGRWVRLRPRQGHCFSIEHRYKLRRLDDTPYGWGSWLSTPPTPPLPAVDALAALEVERTMRHIPKKHRIALKLEYVYRMPWRLICKRLSLPYDCWWVHLSEAQNMVANRLKGLTRQNLGRNLSQIRPSGQPAETRAPDGAIGVCETA